MSVEPRLPGQAPLGGGLPERIEAIDADLAQLLGDPSTDKTNVDAALLLMTDMLHVAVFGDTWARPEPPREVWRSLLRAVVQLATEP